MLLHQSLIFSNHRVTFFADQYHDFIKTSHRPVLLLTSRKKQNIDLYRTNTVALVRPRSYTCELVSQLSLLSRMPQLLLRLLRLYWATASPPGRGVKTFNNLRQCSIVRGQFHIPLRRFIPASGIGSCNRFRSRGSSTESGRPSLDHGYL
ncbi:hypothetical protein K491DRAFT_387708 [Lophiostoma macrostomum CBS 122681]|uniref:Uncharacterized protein n=1 Tax=Lophiostoma macrostomum CBS 122681 TaxID=1314788 RepID=A0A6A6TPU9_9PLEO|nr:hypothetical protein K491DRAFT_387708 [Lophiostoma macrostomum CBS 122681]